MTRPDVLDEEALVARARLSAEGFGAFSRHIERSVLGFFVRATGRAELAADLKAETFACALESIGNHDPARGRGDQWLFGIARNVLGASYRRGRVETAARERLGLPMLVVDNHAAEIISRLARVREQRDYADIAGELSCSEAVVRKRVSRGLQALRARLEPARRPLRSRLGAIAVAFSVAVTLAVAVLVVAPLGHSHTPANQSGRPIAPVGDPVPVGFDPRWVSAISDRQWWLLGQRPCSPRACLAIVRTTNGGRSFSAIPAPRVPYEIAGCGYSQVSQLEFADAINGFAYGCALYVTHDGGSHWSPVTLGGYVTAVATAGGYAYAIVGSIHGFGGKLMRSPVGRDDWVTLLASTNLEPGVVARGSDVFVQSISNHGSTIHLLISHNRGASFSRNNPIGFGIPCGIHEVAAPVVWAFCSGGTNGHVMRSADGGHSFQLAEGGTEGNGASNEYHGAVFGAIDAITAIVGYGQLLRTTDGGRDWIPVGPAGLEWEYLSFIDAKHGIALAAPPSSAPFGSRVYYTSDGGITYHLIPIRSPGGGWIGTVATPRPAPRQRRPARASRDSSASGRGTVHIRSASA